MLQTEVGKMILLIYLVFLLCFYKHTAGMNTTDCENIGDANNHLKLAEELIQIARKKLPTNCQAPLPMDCEELLKNGEKKSGVYSVWPKNRITPGSVSVYCDMETDGGGWTVIQRRGNFSCDKDNFKQDWKAYKEGFGDLKKDFWLGNDKTYALSNQKLYSARFDLGDVAGDKRYAVFKEFWIEEENSNYTLHVSGYSGNAGDSLSFHNGCMFSTKDRKNDKSEGHCARTFGGGWWYKNCFRSNLNGQYYPGKLETNHHGIHWLSWKNSSESLATSEIKIRRNPTWVK